MKWNAVPCGLHASLHMPQPSILSEQGPSVQGQVKRSFLISPPHRTPEFVCIGLMSVMEGMTVAMALMNATVLAKKGFAQVLMKKK